jgi:pyruvate kinase
MLARIAAAVEPTRRRISVDEKFAGVELSGLVRPEHLIAVSVEASLRYLQPAAVVVPSVTGATARRLASLHLPMPVVAVCPDGQTSQDLLFSYGVVPVRERKTPASWSKYLRNWVRQHGLVGEFAILTKRPAAGHHQMEIVEL